MHWHGEKEPNLDLGHAADISDVSLLHLPSLPGSAYRESPGSKIAPAARCAAFSSSESIRAEFGVLVGHIAMQDGMKLGEGWVPVSRPG